MFVFAKTDESAALASYAGSASLHPGTTDRRWRLAIKQGNRKAEFAGVAFSRGRDVGDKKLLFRAEAYWLG